MSTAHTGDEKIYSASPEATGTLLLESGALAGPCKQLQRSLAGQIENGTFLCLAAELTPKCSPKNPK